MSRLRARGAMTATILQVTVFFAAALSLFILLELGPSWALPALGAVFFTLVALIVLAGRARAIAAKVRWWHVVWVFVFVSGLTFRIRDLADIQETAVDSYALLRIVLMSITAAVLLARLAMRDRWVAVLGRGIPGALAAYATVCIVSTAWSVYPSWTFYKGCEYLVSVALLAAIVADAHDAEDYRSLLNTTWGMLAVVLCLVWAGVFLWPQQAIIPSRGLISFQITGVIPVLAANTVGHFSAVLALVAVTRLLYARHYRTWWFAVLGGSGLAMILSQTRSAVAAFLVGLLIVLFFARRRLLYMLLGVSAFAIPSAAVGALVWKYILRGQSKEAFETLTGRVDWWQLAWTKFLEHPIRGFGGYAGGRFMVLAKLGESDTANMHSTYFEVLLGTGLLGMVPIAIAIIVIWYIQLRWLRQPGLPPLDRQLAVETAGVFAVITVRSFASAQIIWHPATLFLVTAAYAEFLRRRRVVVRPVRSLVPSPEEPVQRITA